MRWTCCYSTFRACQVIAPVTSSTDPASPVPGRQVHVPLGGTDVQCPSCRRACSIPFSRKFVPHRDGRGTAPDPAEVRPDPEREYDRLRFERAPSRPATGRSGRPDDSHRSKVGASWDFITSRSDAGRLQSRPHLPVHQSVRGGCQFPDCGSNRQRPNRAAPLRIGFEAAAVRTPVCSPWPFRRSRPDCRRSQRHLAAYPQVVMDNGRHEPGFFHQRSGVPGIPRERVWQFGRKCQMRSRQWPATSASTRRTIPFRSRVRWPVCCMISRHF